MRNPRTLIAAAAMMALPSLAAAAPITVTITNNQAADGLFLTPLLSVFHDGTFDTFDVGGFASAGLEALAEEGDASIEVNRAQTAGHEVSVITSPGGFAGAPVIDPGETASAVFDLDPNANRYFSYLSMVIPSNDLFIGNSNPTANEIFDAAGIFNGTRVIQIFNSRIYDAGTELDDNKGAAFNAAGGTATDTNEAIALQGDATSIFGQSTAAGTSVTSGLQAGDLLATITISAVPLPGAMTLMVAGLGAGALAGKRRRKA